MGTRNEGQAPRIIAATLIVYRVLLILCPGGLRRAYGREMMQVLRQCCRDGYAVGGAWDVARLWLPALGDLLAGASAEYVAVLLHSWKEMWAMNRIRASIITIFCAYIGFVVAGMGFQKLSEYSDFTEAAAAHSVIGVSFAVIFWGSLVALLAVLAGGLPVAFAALRAALAARRRDILLLFAVPVMAFALLAGYLLVALRVTSGETQHITPLDAALAIGLAALFILGAVASAAAVSLAVARSNLSGDLIRFARIPATITALAMLAMCAATIIWGIALRSDAPALFNGNDGFLATSTALHWLAISAVMSVSTIVALVAVVRGFTMPHSPVSAPATT